MNFIKERGIWIIITIIIMCGLYYWVVIDEERVVEMSELEQSDYVLSGDVNEWSESYNRLELKWRGTSKHVKTLQDETSNHYKSYEAKVDSVNNTFDQTNFYFDLEGHIDDSRVQKALEELGFHTQKLDILGVYEADNFRFKNL